MHPRRDLALLIPDVDVLGDQLRRLLCHPWLNKAFSTLLVSPGQVDIWSILVSHYFALVTIPRFTFLYGARCSYANLCWKPPNIPRSVIQASYSGRAVRYSRLGYWLHALR